MIEPIAHALVQTGGLQRSGDAVIDEGSWPVILDQESEGNSVLNGNTFSLQLDRDGFAEKNPRLKSKSGSYIVFE